jgi:4-amino-4-deoxy-L-arabinose transferase-like glycosyltransferase
MIHKWVGTPVALLLILFLYALFLWSFSVPMTGDQKVYLTVALEMMERGEWVIPHLFGEPNFLKPPFQYWSTILGWKIFGFGLFGALFPSVLALLASAILVKKISKSADWTPAVFFASTLASMTYGTTAQMEIWVVLFYLTSWHLYLAGRLGWAFGVVGVMAWIKGPLYSVLWGLGWILHEVLNGNARNLRSPRTFWKLALGIGVGLSWFLLAAKEFPDEVIGVFFKRENLEKLNTPLGSPLGLWSEFLGTLWPMLPWLLICLLDPLNRARILGRWRFYLSFGIFPALFFTFFPYRVGTYLYLLTPLAIWWMSPSPPKADTKGLRFLQGVVLVLGALLAVFLVRLGSGGWIGPILGGFALLSAGLWMVGHFRLSPALIAISSLCLVSAVRLGGIELGSRDLAGLKSATAGSEMPIAYLMEHEDIWHEVGLISSALGTRVHLLKERRELPPFVAAGGRVILADDQREMEGGLTCVEWTRFKRRMKFPLRELIVKGIPVDRPELYRSFRICHSPET